MEGLFEPVIEQVIRLIENQVDRVAAEGEKIKVGDVGLAICGAKLTQSSASS